ncbi:TlpA family protein disulfide reductase [Cloacibacterium sp. TD35]|uniref:TlpA family protein disulfide reductase n=1 Tax=Cloacibacterium sp. TD35 TaxID=2976818 RepID=UPI00237DF610|nr:TlpA disulfide reductase family protein [Cloacibacterium sp. TD35]WDT68006.1 TlpA family protein disulfide reductase [Cloacibacterium sp. TD35]
MKNIFCRAFLSLFLTFLAFTTGLAQNKSLTIGEALPESIWSTPLQIVNHPQKTMTLNQDKDKLILLDFWNTWCSSCLANFPKMEELQKQFGDKIKIIPVSNQDRPTLEKFFATKNGQRYKQVVSVAGDKIFHQLFPHRGVPYIAWIKDGKLLNTTDGAQVTEKTIKELLGGESSSLQTVVQRGRERPLMLSEDFDQEKGISMLSYSFLAKGRIRGMGFGSGFHRSGQTAYGRQFTNLSLLEIFSAITDEIFQKQKRAFNEKRIIIEVKDPKPLENPKDEQGNIVEANLYSYEFIVPLSEADSLYPLMLKNLSQFTDYSADIEKRKVKCLVLKRTSTQDKLKTKSTTTRFSFSVSKTDLQNTSVYALVNNLNALPFIPYPIVDQTGYKTNIDLKMGKIEDLNALRKELLLYDVDLVEEEQELDMLIIKDK